MSRNGSEILYSTFIGGPFDDTSRDIYLDDNKNVIITGFTDSYSFPTTGSYDPTHNGDQDVFLLILNLSVPPGRPVNLSGVAGNSFVNITWERPISDGNATIQGYEVFRRSHFKDFELISTVNESKFFNDTGLYNGTRYHYKVRAFNIAGPGIFSRIINATPMIRPTPPVDLTAEGTDTLVKITWKPPIYSGGNPVWAYTIYRSIDNLDFIKIQENDNQTLSYNDLDVENGIQYFYYITASNDAGESSPSNVAYSSPMGLPSSPTIVANHTGSHFIEIRWEAPEDNGGSGITGYRIYKGTKIGSESFVHSVENNIHEYNDTSIQIGTAFYYYVTAVNEVGESLPSNRMAVLLIVKPDHPESFRAIGHDGFVELSWDEPISDGGSEIGSFNIYKGEDPDDLKPLISLNGDSSSYSDHEVENGNHYYYQISAVNERYESDLSGMVTARPLGVTSPPVIVNYDVGDGFVHLYWDKPANVGGDLDITFILYRNVKGEDPEEIDVFDKSVMDYNDTDVTNGVEYHYHLVVENLKGFSDPSNSIIALPMGVPSPVADIRITGGSGFIQLHWTPPDDDGGTNITGLIIFRSEDGEEYQILEEIDLVSDIGVYDGDIDFYNDTSVVNGIRYFYYIVVENVVGKSASSIIVDDMAKGVPQPPSNISVLTDENNIFINWTHPRNNGGSAVLKYMIYCSQNGDEFELVNIVSGDQNSWIDDDLSNGIYEYSITAVNEYGESDPIETSTIDIDHSDQEDHIFEVIFLTFIILLFLLISLILLYFFLRKKISSNSDGENHIIEEENINGDHPENDENNILSVNE